jgi:hypothetical protein
MFPTQLGQLLLTKPIFVRFKTKQSDKAVNAYYKAISEACRKL